MSQKKKKQIFKLEDVDVETVGLVPVGANQTVFHLLKSIDGKEEIMPEDIKDVEKVLSEEELAAVADGIVKDESFLAKIGKIVGIGKEDEPEEDPVEEPTDDTDDAEDVRKEYAAKMVKLQKQTDELTAQLEKAQAEADLQREENALRAEIEKAQSFTAVPAKPNEIAKLAYYLRDSNEELATWFDGFVETVNKQIEESKLFTEFGSSIVEDEPEGLVAKATKMVDEDGVTWKEALLKMSPKEQAKYLADRQSKIKTGQK